MNTVMTEKRGGIKSWFLMIGALVLLILLIGGIKGYGAMKMFQAFASQGAPKFTVSTIKAEYQDWLPQLSAVGSLRAERGADLSAEVAGIVNAINFKSGDDVKAGQLLLQLRSADDEAHLESLKAAAALAESVNTRDQAQFKAGAVSQATLDSDAANLRSARAQVAEQQALVAKKYVRAPFAGHLGIRAVDLGQYLAAGTKIVTLQQLDPIYVDFYLPQQALGQIKVGQKLSAASDTYPEQSFGGQVVAIDPRVDTDTRNVQVRAALGNAERKLLPGMYANVSIEIGAPARQLTLPQTAVAYNPYGATVYIVVPHVEKPKEGEVAKPAQPSPSAGPDLEVKQVFVTTGATRGDQVAILKGVNEGDEVVTSGQIKLRNGALVTINNSVQPSNDPNPKPVEE
jgi:membrane fusion protein (multidrug efflux system)